MDVAQAEQTQTGQPPIEIVQDEVQETSSISAHMKQFGPGAEKADPPAEATADPLKPIRPVDQQKRDQGKFAEGKQRLKASEAVERINKLTARAKTAEENLAKAESELARLRAAGGTRTEIKQAEQKVERAEARVESPPSTFNEPEPDENDPKFEGDYAKYMRAVAAWEGRKAYHGEKQAERESQQKAQREQSERESLTAAGKRFDAAKTKYQDFEAVAFSGAARIPEGSPVDLFIMEDESGPDVLYHLNKHPQELDSILQMTALQQVKRLVAIATELSPKSTATGSTTAAAETKKPVILPKPPTVVRTEAQKSASDVPPTDGSLSLAEHAKRFGPKARR
jgi:hypothetical protein